MIQYVIFDMNGIIINDEWVHELAFQQVLNNYDIQLTSADYLRYIAGQTDREGLSNYLKSNNYHLDLKGILKQKSSKYLELFPKHKATYPGLLALIKRLSSNYTLALASGAIRKEVELVLNEFKLRPFFKVTLSADDVAKGKPDPEQYLLTAEKLGASPIECVVIEDSKSGVVAAKSAGMQVIAVTTTHAKQDLIQADRIVDNFSEINSEVINNLNPIAEY